MSRTARSIVDGDAETTWEERFTNVISRFCNGHPPLAIIRSWFGPDDDLRLQEWVNCNLHPSALWAQGIEIIDAATRLAESPAECGAVFGGVRVGPHHPRPDPYPPER